MNSEKKKNNLSRRKIINSAIVLFANKGFDSASTREICRQAGVNLSLIPYYFGNKEGLYINIIESIINYGLASLQEEILKVKNIDKLTLTEKLDIYRSLLEKYTEFLYSENVPGSFVVLILKEQIVAHTKFSDIYSQKIEVLYSALRKTLASILNKSDKDKMIAFEVASIIGQILGYKLMDKAILTSLNQDSYTRDDFKKVKKIVMSYIDKSIEKITSQNNSEKVVSLARA